MIPGDHVSSADSAPSGRHLSYLTSQEAGLPDDVLETDKNNFAPRIGFAFRPFADSRTIISGGAGLLLQYPAGLHRVPSDGSHQSAFPAWRKLLRRPPGPYAFADLAEQPFPGAGALSPNPAITAVERNIKNSLAQQWNLTVEREWLQSLGSASRTWETRRAICPGTTDRSMFRRQQAAGRFSRGGRTSPGRISSCSPAAATRPSISCRSRDPALFVRAYLPGGVFVEPLTR